MTNTNCLESLQIRSGIEEDFYEKLDPIPSVYLVGLLSD